MPTHMSTVKYLALQDAATKQLWDAFVLRHPQATFCHRAGWQQVLHEVFGHDTYFIYLEREGQICGVLPLAHVRSRLFGNSLAALPFAVYGGVVANDPSDAASLEAEALALARRLRVNYLELRHVEPRNPDGPTKHLYATFRKAILPEEEANLRAIPRRQRAMVRKGINSSLTFKVEDHLRHFYPLYANNVHRHGTPALPRRWFESLQRQFGVDCEVMTVCDPAGRPVSSVLSFYFRDEVMPYYAGDTLAARDLAANDFKYWTLMRRACLDGRRMFDFGRSKVDTGPFAYKKNWGFEPTPLNYEYSLLGQDRLPQHNPSNPRYALAIKIWRRMPLNLSTRIGPLLSRSLG
jgi:FemAB-related protein (PEP-CTERM system-associated)